MSTDATPLSAIHSVILSTAALFTSPELAAIRDEGFVQDSASLDDHVRAALRLWLQDRIPAQTPEKAIEARMARAAFDVLGVYDTHRLSDEVAASLLDSLLETARLDLLRAIADVIRWAKLDASNAPAPTRSGLSREALEQLRRDFLGIPHPEKPDDKAPPEPVAAEVPKPPKPPFHDGGVVASNPARRIVQVDIANAAAAARPTPVGFDGAEIAAAQACLHSEWRKAQNHANELYRAMTTEGLLKALQAARAEQSVQAAE